MKTCLGLLVLPAAALVFAASSSRAEEAEEAAPPPPPPDMFFVATTGSDEAPGTYDEPFATLERARAAVRERKRQGLPEGGLTVWMRGGTYRLARTLALISTDGGEPGRPVCWRAFPTEEVRLTGGTELRGFRPVEGSEAASRLDRRAGRKVVQCDLRACGVNDFGRIVRRGFNARVEPSSVELFFNGEPMRLARWPNTGWTEVAEAAGKTGFVASDDRAGRWRDAPDPWMMGFWHHDWAPSCERATSISGRRISMDGADPPYGLKKGVRFRAFNILAELDEPGEYYLDRVSGVLYFWPPSPIAEGSAYVSDLQKVVDISGASHLVLRDLVIEGARGTVLGLSGGEGVLIAGCTIRNAGRHGMTVRGGKRHSILGCDVSGCGDSGIDIRAGERRNLTRADHLVENCDVHHVGRWVMAYEPCIKLAGCCGVDVRNNRIHHSPHNGIHYTGNDCDIAFNEFHDVCLDTGDVGAIYAWTCWGMGTTIRHNYFHDVVSRFGFGATCVYLDDLSSCFEVRGNVFLNCSQGAGIGGGRRHRVENNLFVNCGGTAVWYDARGLGWNESKIAVMRERMQGLDHLEPPYITRFPYLKNILSVRPGAPVDNVIARNVFYQCKRGVRIVGQVPEQDRAGVRDNFTEGGKWLLDPASGFALRRNSRAVAAGFRPIRTPEIGLYLDEYRRTIPRGAMASTHSAGKRRPKPPRPGEEPPILLPDASEIVFTGGLPLRRRPEVAAGEEPAEASAASAGEDGRQRRPARMWGSQRNRRRPDVRSAESERAAELARLFKEAETLFIDGEFEKAAGSFREVVSAEPGSGLAEKARQYLEMIE